MKGDIIDYDNSDKVLKLNPGSIIKVINVRGNSSNVNIGDYILRTKILKEENRIIGVTLLSKTNDKLGCFWYSSLDNYKFEIIKET